MNDRTVGQAYRALRRRKRWRQEDLARRAGLSVERICAIEHGQLELVPFRALRDLARALGASAEVLVRWEGADLDRLINARHSAMHEAVARWMNESPGWEFAPEVSFSIYGERGIIDILAFHRPTRTLLVIELKTDIVDVQDLIGTVDRKRRLAPIVATSRGWCAARVAVWVIVAPSRTNERRIAAHGGVLRAAFPADGRHVAPWLRRPRAAAAILSFLPAARMRSGSVDQRGVRRVRVLPSKGVAQPATPPRPAPARAWVQT